MAFDPDAFLSGESTNIEDRRPKPFDPDEFLKEAAPAPATEAGSAGGAFLRGAIPGGNTLIPRAEAAIRATMQPLTGVGAPGETWSERYAANVPKQEESAQQFDTQRPYASTALKVGGGTAALAPIGATSLGARALGLAGPWATRPLAGAATTGGLAAADAAINGGDVGQALKEGVGIGAATPFVGAAAQRVLGGAAPRINTPALSPEALQAAGGAGYNAVRDVTRGSAIGGGSGVGPYVKELVTDAMEAKGAPRAARAGDTWKEIDRIAAAKDVGDLVDIHQNLSRIVRSGKGEDIRAAGIARGLVANEIDRIVPGQAAKLRTADKNYAIGKRAEDVEAAAQDARTAAQSSRYGTREGTQLRRMARPFLESDAQNVSPAVAAAADRVARPGIGARAMQALSVGDPSRGYLNLFAAPFSLSNPISAGVHGTSMAVGYPAGKIYDAMMRQRMRGLSEMIRQEAPATMAQPGYRLPTMPTLQPSLLSLGALPYSQQRR